MPDPRGFVTQADIQNGCGWSDAGNDAFDCFGTFTLTVNGAAAQIDISLGQRVVEINPRNVQAMRELRLSQMRDQKEKKKPLITLSGESTFLSKLFKKDE